MPYYDDAEWRRLQRRARLLRWAPQAALGAALVLVGALIAMMVLR